MNNSSQNNLIPAEQTCLEREQKQGRGKNDQNRGGLPQEQIHFGDNYENDEDYHLDVPDDGGGGETVIFQQVESLDRLFVEGREKPPKFINSRYLIGAQLGQGSYGKVKEILDTFTLQRKAVKIMNKQKLKKIPNGEQNALKEFHLMRKLCHKNVLKVFDLLRREQQEIVLEEDVDDTVEGFSSSNMTPNLRGNQSRSRTGQRSLTKPEKLYLVMQYCVCGLHDLLQNAPDNKLPSWQAHRYFCDLVEGIEYLHSRRIVHKDIKPQNLLIAPDESVKLADFGVAEELDFFTDDSTLKSSAGTPMFQSPEVSAGKASFCGFKLDVWSAGITLFNITTGTYPFSGANIYLLLENISTQTVTIPSDLAPQLQTLLEGMLEKNPIHRFSISQVKSHRWVTQKHCVTPEKVPLPPFVDNRHGFQQQHVPSFQNSSTANEHHYQQQQFRANSSAHSIAFYDSDIVNSLEKIFNITDSDAGMSKVEANDVMHSAGGGAATGTTLGAADFSKQQISQSNTTNSNEHANNNIINNAPVSSSYHQLHSQSHGAQNTSEREQPQQQEQSSHDDPNRRSSGTPQLQQIRNTNGVSAVTPADPLFSVESEIVKSSDVTDPSNQSKSRTAAGKQKKKCEVM